MCLFYVDDIIIYLSTVEKHLGHVDNMSASLKHAGITLKIKCNFFSTNVEYLGHVVKFEKLKTDHAHSKSVKNALSPTNKSESRSFLGLCSVYCRFVGSFVHKSGFLYRFLHKPNPKTFFLSKEKIQAFRPLIDVIHLRPSRHFLNMDYRTTFIQKNHFTDSAALSTKPAIRKTDTQLVTCSKS